MQDFEKLGLFYLGASYDLASKRRGNELTLYDARDLVTHALTIGMTGSGKTGLCIGLLEEAALDGIPAIVIDPKGDLANLLLTFPNLDAADFLPWVNPDDARRASVSPEEYARQQATLWREGLAEWGQDGARIRRLREAAEVAVYTPGSTAGLPLSVLKSLEAPAGLVREDEELFNERINTTATSLLGLVGIEADPIRSREHILLSTILGNAWKGGESLELGAVIQEIQTPPVSRIGVLDLESFFPSRERFEFAMRVNNLLAAPGFEAWTAGDPLDVDRLLHDAAGKPRVAIMSIAHLSDAERMFFVALLLGEVLGWVRAQSGTTSLRAVLYMDEIAGYFPPVANPPSKAPLLTLLKQARAYGLGIVLATQNPVDLDYKGLANIGTWFLGRLQTERDKNRLLDGLEGAAGQGNQALNRKTLDATLSALKNRVFLMRNVHDDGPAVFETRWAMSYLRGPLTRDQIRVLMSSRPGVEAAAPQRPAPGAAVRDVSQPGPAAISAAVRGSSSAPILPPDVTQYFMPSAATAAGHARFEPKLFIDATLRYADSKLGLDDTLKRAFLVPMTESAAPVTWDQAKVTDLGLDQLTTDPPSSGTFADLPRAATTRKSYDIWAKDFVRWATHSQTVELFKSRPGVVSRPNETERDFRVRLRQAGRETRDQELQRLRQRYAARMASQTERIRRSETSQARETEQASQQKLQTALSFGATLVGALLGRKAVSASTLGRATTAARGVGRSMKESQDAERAAQNVQAERSKLENLEADLAGEIAALEGADPSTEPLDTIIVRPKRGDVMVRAITLAWEGTPSH